MVQVLPSDGGIRFENALNDVGSEVVFEAIGAVGLRLDVTEERARDAHLLADGVGLGLVEGVLSVLGPKLFGAEDLSDDQIFVKLE